MTTESEQASGSLREFMTPEECAHADEWRSYGPTGNHRVGLEVRLPHPARLHAGAVGRNRRIHGNTHVGCVDLGDGWHAAHYAIPFPPEAACCSMRRVLP